MAHFFCICHALSFEAPFKHLIVVWKWNKAQLDEKKGSYAPSLKADFLSSLKLLATRIFQKKLVK